jgi:hypothetical protein
MEKKMGRKPRVNSEGSKELERIEKKFDEYKDNMDKLTKDQADLAPILQTEEQTKLSTKEKQEWPAHHIKPTKTIASRDKFNDKYRKDYEFKKEYVNFITENVEIIGESIEMWTKPFAGIPAEFWKIPVNKPVWAPRYVAEQIRNAKYHTYTMNQQTYENTGDMQYYGSMVVKNTNSRLKAEPVVQGRSTFMGG